MIRLLTHPLFLSILTTVGLYVIFRYVIWPPIPQSLLIQYMVFCVIGILMVGTFHEPTAKRMADPLRALLGHPKLLIPRIFALVTVVVGVSAFTYSMVKPDANAPIELRTVHPAPPSSIRVYGKSFNLLSLTNPLRDRAEKGSDEFKELVSQGGELYYKNCLYCHGDLLDGQGPFSAGFNPRPANFQDVGTIAQLQESYLFWRITTGAPGLPREGAPWASAMPVWHELLGEEEVWKIILFLYDYTGYVPRSWELEGGGAAAPEASTVAKAPTGDDTKALDEDAVNALYLHRCAHCHGEEGDGQGPAAEFMFPKPRDFTLGTFKYKTTHADDEFPTDDDLRRTIRDGLPGTAMPGWKSLLNDVEIDGLIHLIKSFGEWEEEEIEHRAIDEGTPVESSPESIAKGRELFVKACQQCHGQQGRGDITSGKRLKDDWQDRIWPRNLTRPSTWRSTRDTRDIFQRISTGIRGTPMPEHTTTMKTEDRWHVANYVSTLRQNAVPLVGGETVLRGVRIDGDLPESPDDPAWQQALPITFAMVPNIIKDPRLFVSLNDRVTVRALFNDRDIALRLDVDDRTYSVPGDKLEKMYRLEGVEPTPDAVSVQFPAEIPTTSEKPWFRHGDPNHTVNMWYWRAPSVEPKTPGIGSILDAAGPNKPPSPRDGEPGLQTEGEWKDGQWRVVMKRSLATDDAKDLQFAVGRYIPIAFANWDGLAGEKGGRHSLTSWYWLLLEPKDNPMLVFGSTGASGMLAGLLFLGAARRQKRLFSR